MTWELGAEHLAFRDTCRAFTDREVRPLVDDAEAPDAKNALRARDGSPIPPSGKRGA